MFERLKNAIIIMVKTFFAKKVPRSAAAMSYYLTLSFFPFLICLSYIIGLFNIDINEVVRLVGGIMPKNSVEITKIYLEYVKQSSSQALLFAGFTMFLTSLSAAVRSLIGVLEDINEKERTKGILSFILSFSVATFLLFGTYACMLISVTSVLIFGFIKEYLGIDLLIYGNLSFLILFAFMFFVLTMIYKMSMPKGTPYKKIWIGSLTSAILVVVLSGAFSYFLDYSTRYSLVYGSLTSFMLLMIWLFMCGVIIISGCVLNLGINKGLREQL